MRQERSLWALLAVLAGALPVVGQSRVVLVLADDLGVEQLALYRPEVRVLARTPAIDELAERGITFRNAWVNPLCSPTRATIQTGLYACRPGNGIGNVIEKDCADHSLPVGGELPTWLPGFRTAAFGKWHLEDPLGADPVAPRTHGYGYFEGHLWAVPSQCGPVPPRPCSPAQLLEGSNYYSWRKTTIDSSGNLSLSPVNEYMPSATFDAAARWLETNWRQPSFTYLGVQAPFELQHCPPSSLQSVVNCNECIRDTRCPAGIFTNKACYKAAVEAFDAKLGELLRSIDDFDPQPWWRTTTIVFLGDNGSGIFDTGYWAPGEGKASLFNGGIHAPLIIAGRAVPKSRHGLKTNALANGVDIFATVIDIAGQPIPPGIDGVSLVPVLQTNTPVRSFLYSERFDNNGPGPYSKHFQTAANASYTYKLRRVGGADWFYRLAPRSSEPAGPKQETLLCTGVGCGALSPVAAAEYQALKAFLDGVCP